jgi:hypothetical protein
MRCQMCGHDSPPAAFCLHCGSSLSAPTPAPVTAAPPQGLPVAGTVMCGTCRADNPPGMKFCRHCGNAVAGPAQVLASEPATLMPHQPIPQNTPAWSPAPTYNPPSAPLAAPTPMRLTPQAAVCPRCQTAVQPGVVYCQSCGLHMQAMAPTAPGAGPGSRPPAIDALAPTSAAVGPGAIRAGSIRPPTSDQNPLWGFATLVNRDGSDGERFSLQNEHITIGRVGADLSFDQDRFLGRPHARIERVAGGGARVIPMDTVNGVFRKCDAPVEIADGGVFLVGREVLRFERVAADERAAEPLVQHGVAMFGSPPREPWGRLLQLLPSSGVRDVRYMVAVEVTLGREEGDWVFRDDAFMSRRHATLAWDGRKAILTDLNSSNGTFFRLSGPLALRTGDQLRMGDQLLRFELTR